VRIGFYVGSAKFRVGAAGDDAMDGLREQFVVAVSIARP
jgi:hypothetical protein